MRAFNLQLGPRVKPEDDSFAMVHPNMATNCAGAAVGAALF
jgi:hypothetical protein